MPKKSKWPIAVFIAKKFVRAADFIMNLKNIVLNIKNAPLIFVTPVPLPAAVLTRLDELEAAELVVKTRVVGSKAARDVKYDASYKDLNSIVNYVQDTADAAPDAAAAIAIIEAAGLNVKVNGSRMKAPIEARYTTDEGVVKLIAKSGGRNTIYIWQASGDGNNWSDLPVTGVANTSVDGLTAGVKKYFRVRTKNKDGISEWSAAVVIMVV